MNDSDLVQKSCTLFFYSLNDKKSIYTDSKYRNCPGEQGMLC